MAPKPRPSRPALWAALAAILIAGWGTGVPAAADILVTRDGARVETDGPWKEKGRLVVFTRPDGTLASLRLSEVDLEASREATEGARRAAEEAAARQSADEEEESTAQPATPQRPSRWSFTDADFTNRRPAAATGEDEAAAPATTGEPADDTSPPEVTDWDREFDPVDQHVTVIGRVTNHTSALATAVGLQVALYDDSGELIESRQAQLDRPVLQPGQEVGFRADFPDVYTYSAVRFQTSSTNLAVAQSGEARTGAEAEAEAEEAARTEELEGDGAGGGGTP